jgi:hypothetical protein
MDAEVRRRLHYAAAVACGVFAALVMHIVLTVSGVGLDLAFRDPGTGVKTEFVAALAWWTVAIIGFLGGGGTAAYLIAATRERDFVYKLAQGLLVAVVFAVATAGGIMSNSTSVGGTADVIASLSAVIIGLICAFCGARFAYLNAGQA